MDIDILISVIIPVYNVEKYLAECIDSVLKQTYGNYEIILVDDGSIDDSGKICDEYAKNDKRIAVIHQENMGQATARNNGLYRAIGKYIYFLDSDDYIEPDTLKKLVKKAEIEEADIVFFDAVSFNDDTGKKSERQSYMKKMTYEACSGKEMFSKLQKNKEFNNAVPLTFLRHTFLINNNLEYIPGITMEDILFSFQVMNKAERAVHLREVLYHRRYRAGSVTKSVKTKNHFKSSCIIYYRLLDFVKNNSLENDASNQYISRCAYNTLDLFDGMKREDRAAEKQELKKLKSSIICNKSFGQKALRARCIGKLPWAVVRAVEKLTD